MTILRWTLAVAIAAFLFSPALADEPAGSEQPTCRTGECGTAAPACEGDALVARWLTQMVTDPETTPEPVAVPGRLRYVRGEDGEWRAVREGPAAPAVPAKPAMPTPPAPFVKPPLLVKPSDSAASGQFGYLGIAPGPVSETLADQLGLDDGRGVVVAEVMPDSPAAKAGLVANDVLTMVDDQIIFAVKQLQKLVASHKPGDTVKLTFVHKGKMRFATATLSGTDQAAWKQPGACDGQCPMDMGGPGENPMPKQMMPMLRRFEKMEQQRKFDDPIRGPRTGQPRAKGECPCGDDGDDCDCGDDNDDCDCGDDNDDCDGPCGEGQCPGGCEGSCEDGCEGACDGKGECDRPNTPPQTRKLSQFQIQLMPQGGQPRVFRLNPNQIPPAPRATGQFRGALPGGMQFRVPLGQDNQRVRNEVIDSVLKALEPIREDIAPKAWDRIQKAIANLRLTAKPSVGPQMRGPGVGPRGPMGPGPMQGPGRDGRPGMRPGQPMLPDGNSDLREQRERIRRFMERNEFRGGY